MERREDHGPPAEGVERSLVDADPKAARVLSGLPVDIVEEAKAALRLIGDLRDLLDAVKLSPEFHERIRVVVGRLEHAIAHEIESRYPVRRGSRTE